MTPVRRSFLLALTTALGLFTWFSTTKGPNPMASVAPFVKPREKWAADHFFNFLNALPPHVMLALKKSLGILDQTADQDQLKGTYQDTRDIQKHALWLSTNVLSYPFLDETKLSYHDLVTWVFTEIAHVPESKIKAAPSFILEREIQKILFASQWDKLNMKQRNELFLKIDPNDAIKDKAAIAAMTGAGALAVLSGTVAFHGFAFYTTMSVTIAATASAIGLNLPFATYTSASSVVGILSGPVGWAIMGAVALGGVALKGRANLRKTASLIGQLHSLKIEALVAAGVPEQDIFNA